VADDFSELYELAADMRSAGNEVGRFVKKAVEVTARNVKDDWQQGAEAAGLGNYSRSIDYDIKFPGGAVEAEIGPNHAKRQGKFGFVEEGGDDVRSAPQHAGRDAKRANEDDFVRGLEIAIFDATKKAVRG